ncbi:MAG: hypothetical protein OEU91_08570 [Gammaproteobacteria bacterium]|nr:hypothetical protein [Gammaproteobacteria bacterium]
MTQLGDAAVSCDASCNSGENYTLDAAFHVNGAGFTTVPYVMHLEGAIGGEVVPLPPTKEVNVLLTGGSSQECSSTGGSLIEATADIRTSDTDDIASISWSLDGGAAGSGTAIDVFIPLGSHTISVFVDTLASGTFESSEQVIVADNTPPDLNVIFIDQQSGQEVTEISGDGSHFVTVLYDVTDVCDPDPVASGVAVPVHAVDDGDTIKITNKEVSKTNLGTSAVNVSADATDASGNQRHSGATLLIAD